MSLSYYKLAVILDKDAGGQNGAANQALSIYKADGVTLATIYSDGAATLPIAQPGAVTDANGNFEFYASAGTYIAESASFSLQIFVGKDATIKTFASLQDALDYDSFSVDGISHGVILGIGEFEITDTNTGGFFQELTKGGLFIKPIPGDRKSLDIRMFGAVGDWNGTTGTDDRPAAQACASYLKTLGGGELIIDDGDYLLGQSLNITSSNLHVNIPPTGTLRVNDATSFGQALGFSSSEAFSGNYGVGQISNVGVYGGGTIIAIDADGTNENAVGFVDCRQFFCVGMNFPNSNRKAVTAQINVQDGWIARNYIGFAGSTDSGAITVQGAFDVADAALPLENIIVEDNIIADTASRGVYATKLFSNVARNIIFRNNIILEHDLAGVEMRGIDNPESRGNKCYTTNSSAVAGNIFRDCHNVTGDVHSEGPVNFGVHMLTFDTAIKSDGFDFDSIYVKDCTQDPMRLTSVIGGGNIGMYRVEGSTHEYQYREIGGTQTQKVVINNFEAPAGTLGDINVTSTDFYPWLPIITETNSNGTLTKYPDGTMICTRDDTYDFTTATNATYAMPENFIATPQASISFQSTATTGRHNAFIGSCVMAAATEWRVANNVTVAETLNIHLFAKGRWRAVGPLDN